MADSRPIGIFDSGVGGLTLAYELTKAFPRERLIFFGDTAHLPYGDKSSHAIKHFSEHILKFLLKQNCKAIIIACNTASSVAYYHVTKQFGSSPPIVNVIDPVVNYCLENIRTSKVGVIGTKGTIRSRAYPKKFMEKKPDIKVTTASTPLLAPMIEEGFYNNNISQTIINTYLAKNQFKGIGAMVLACTHYPLIKEEVKAYYQGELPVIDNSDSTIAYVQGLFEQGSLASNESSLRDHQFYVSDYTKAFQETAKLFFGHSVSLEEWDIWGIDGGL